MRQLQNVDVVVRPCDTQIRMPDLQRVVSNDCQNHRGVFAFESSSELPFPSHHAVPPLLVHTIDADNHIWKTVHPPVRI